MILGVKRRVDENSEKDIHRRIAALANLLFSKLLRY